MNGGICIRPLWCIKMTTMKLKTLTKTKTMTMKQLGFILTIVILMAITLTTACNSGGTKKTYPTAIEMMVDVFEGNHSKTKVKDKMDAVMTAYNVEITQKNYEKCGSVLVSLRKATGVTEIDIIDNMVEANTGKDGISFPDQAGLSAFLLEKK